MAAGRGRCPLGCYERGLGGGNGPNLHLLPPRRSALLWSPPSTSLARWKREGVGRVVRARTHAGPGVLGRTTPAPSAGCRGRGHNRSSVLKGRQGLEHSLAHWIVTGARGIVWTLLKEHLGHNIVIQLYLEKRKKNTWKAY